MHVRKHGAALTHPVGLFTDVVKLVHHRLGEDGSLAGVQHVGHTVDHVVEGRQLLVARTVWH